VRAAGALAAAILQGHQQFVLANDNGRAVTPPAGWRSWVRTQAACRPERQLGPPDLLSTAAKRPLLRSRACECSLQRYRHLPALVLTRPVSAVATEPVPSEGQPARYGGQLQGSARICSTRFIGAIGGRCVGTIGMVHPDTLFHRRQQGIPMHSYENRSQIRALLQGARLAAPPGRPLPPVPRRPGLHRRREFPLPH
jgi:hypothetical protein